MSDSSVKDKRGSVSSKVVVLLVIIIAALAAAGGAYGYHLLSDEGTEPAIVKEETISITLQIERAFPISEIMTYQVNYSEVIHDQQTASFELFDIKLLEWLDKKALVILRGVLKFGFDGSEVTIAEYGDRLVITVPRVKVLAGGVNDEVEVYDQQGNYTFEESMMLANQTKDEIVRAFEEDEEILRAAQMNAETILRSIIQGIPGTEKYTLEFVVAN